ncbi:hypothetical protein MSAN_02121300 [Mycena sanguinolenta]|uniref:Uncharacterized protein n=1 Tax=Mycena sanguinolenta TaxID=230812 RepID=A0A8H6XGX3_9AGAR|nr:hypothetical protein MSAN_02121300 [Mycena sanguinolenta]
MLFLPNTDSRSTWIIGGIGGMGGDGAYEGGEGGVGEASHIPTGRVSSCTKIFGGIGGGGGTGSYVGGTGGTGRGSVFYELLGDVDKMTLTGKPRPLSDLSIHEDLRKRLRQQGFVTVGALFMVSGGDLLKVDGFELGDICALKWALKSF